MGGIFFGVVAFMTEVGAAIAGMLDLGSADDSGLNYFMGIF